MVTTVAFFTVIFCESCAHTLQKQLTCFRQAPSPCNKMPSSDAPIHVFCSSLFLFRNNGGPKSSSFAISTSFAATDSFSEVFVGSAAQYVVSLGRIVRRGTICGARSEGGEGQEGVADGVGGATNGIRFERLRGMPDFAKIT